MPINHPSFGKLEDGRVIIFDTTLRDGEQSPGFSMNLNEKIRMAEALTELGVDVLEAGFAIASPGDFESVRTIAETIGQRADSPVLASLSRAGSQDVMASAEALKAAKRKRIHIVIATSDLHMEHKLRLTRDEVIAATVESIKLARNHADDVEWSAEDATRSDIDFLARCCEAAIKAGATTINLPDTVGYAMPEDMARMYTQIREKVPGIETVILSTHNHNDLGMGVANTLAAIRAGARQVESTINGIGERAGNASLEEIVMAIRTRPDAMPYKNNIQTTHLLRMSKLLAAITGFDVQPNKAIVGRNAFAHEAGIHQDGFLKERTTYEIIEPRSVGVPESKLILGKHSGRHALAKRCEALGFDLNREQLDTVYHRFTTMADRKKGMRNDEISALAREVVEESKTARAR